MALLTSRLICAHIEIVIPNPRVSLCGVRDLLFAPAALYSEAANGATFNGMGETEVHGPFPASAFIQAR
jgi:hypothetical protein